MPAPEKIDHAFSQRVADFCIGQTADFATRENLSTYGLAFTMWDGADAFQARPGQPSPLSRAPNGKIVTADTALRFKRVLNTLAEMESLGHHAPTRLDMHDARDYGTPADPRLTASIVVYNRQKTAKNLVLWPLAPYHTFGNPKFVHPTPIDQIPFTKKSDLAVWRGNLTGRPNAALAPKAKHRRFAQSILEELADDPNEEKLWHLHEELMGSTRYNFVLRYFMSDEMNVALTLRNHHAKAKQTSLLKPLCKDRMPVEWFFGFKYAFSLSGNDTGSNFLMAANSNAVILKEEDGWELFYTAEFRPWEHYIPLSRGALDAEEKLAWAKQNPNACQKMSKAAQAVCAKFASPANRQFYLTAILEHLRKPR